MEDPDVIFAEADAPIDDHTAPRALELAPVTESDRERERDPLVSVALEPGWEPI